VQTAVVHGQNFSNPADGLLTWTGQAPDQFIRSELFEFANRMDTQQNKSLARRLVVLEDDIERGIDGDL